MTMTPLILAADTKEQLEGAAELGLATVVLNMPQSPVIEQLTQALLTAVATNACAESAFAAANTRSA